MKMGVAYLFNPFSLWLIGTKIIKKNITICKDFNNQENDDDKGIISNSENINMI